MKKIVFLFVFLLMFSSAFGETLSLSIPDEFLAAYSRTISQKEQIFFQKFSKGEWSTPVQVTDTPAFNISPSIAITYDDTIWVAWSGFDNVNTSIYAKRFQGEEISEEYRVSLPDAFEDSQPSLDITSGGTPVIVWAANDGMDDEIVISSFEGAAWSNEETVNIPNNTPDVDPCVVSFEKRTVIVWSGLSNGTYVLQAAERKNSSSFEEKALSFSSNDMAQSFPSLLKNESLRLFYFSGPDMYASVLNKSDLSPESSAEKIKLPKGLEDSFKKLDLKGVSNLSICYLDEKGNNHTLNMTPALEPMQTRNEKAFPPMAYYLKDFFFSLIFEGEALAVTANKNTAFGDSITEGYKSTGGGYPGRLTTKLGQTVVNRGLGGEKTDDGLKRINSVLSADDPQRILIMEGTNDMNSGRSISSTIFNLREMVNRSMGYGSTPYLATICPSNRQTDRTRLLNAEIRSAATQLGITNPDIDSAFKSVVTPTYFFDDIHPNDAGYDVIANTFYTAIVPASSSSGGGSGGCGTVSSYYGSGRGGINFSLVAFVLLFFLIRRPVIKAARR